MNRVHCDICDKLVFGYQQWCEIEGPNSKHIVHVNIEQVGSQKKDYCIDCWKKILSALLTITDSEK